MTPFKFFKVNRKNKNDRKESDITSCILISHVGSDIYHDQLHFADQN